MAEMTLIGVDEDWLAGRLTGAMRFGGKKMGKGRRAAVGAMYDGQRI